MWLECYHSSSSNKRICNLSEKWRCRIISSIKIINNYFEIKNYPWNEFGCDPGLYVTYPYYALWILFLVVVAGVDVDIDVEVWKKQNLETISCHSIEPLSNGTEPQKRISRKQRISKVNPNQHYKQGGGEVNWKVHFFNHWTYFEEKVLHFYLYFLHQNVK